MTWFWQMTDDASWDRQAASYTVQRKRWQSWTGGNERRTEDRRQAKAVACVAASKQQEASNVELDQLVAALVEPLLDGIDADGTVLFHSMVPSFECECDAELMLLLACATSGTTVTVVHGQGCKHTQVHTTPHRAVQRDTTPSGPREA